MKQMFKPNKVAKFGTKFFMSRALLCMVSGIAIAGCQTAGHNSSSAMTFQERHPIVMKQVHAFTAIPVDHYSADINHEDMMKIEDAYKGFAKAESDMFIDIPVGGHSTQNAVQKANNIKNTLVSIGMDANRIITRTYQGHPNMDAYIKIGYLKTNVTPQKCGLWPENVATMPGNGQYWNFGCATQNNLGVMVADPQDLVVARPVTPKMGSNVYKPPAETEN